MRKLLKQEVYNSLRERAASFYGTQQAVRHVINSTSIAEGSIDLQGPAIYIWDSLLSYSENEGKLVDVVRFIQGEYTNDAELKHIHEVIEDGSAFIDEINYAFYIKPHTGSKAKVLLIYDPGDIVMAEKLITQLYPLELTGAIEVRDMYQGIAGLDKQTVWLNMVGETDIVLLLLTPKFFTPGNSCLQLGFSGFEMRKTVVPVLMADSLWGRIQVLKNIVPLPIEGIPVSKWELEDEALMKVAEGVDTVAKRIKK
jgi:hypothetical protein